MSIFTNYSTDAKIEVEGVAIPLGFNDDKTEMSIVISRLGGANKQYLRALEIAQKPHRRAIQLGTIDKDLHERLVRDVFATHIIKGWSNIQDETGNAIVYNDSNAKMLLEKLPNLYDELFVQAQNLDNFRAEVIEADVKN